MERMKKWNWAVVLCLVLLGGNLWQARRISDLERDIGNAQNSLMDYMGRIDRRLASLSSEWEGANSLVQDWEYVTAVDRETRSLDVAVSVVLKEWRTDTAAGLLWKNLYGKGGGGEASLSGNGMGTFAGTLKLPLSELSGEYTLELVIQNGDTQRREELGHLGDAAGLLPVRCNGYGAGGPVYSTKTGTFTVPSCEAELDGKEPALDRTADHTFRLSRNGETAAEQAAKQGDRLGSYTCGELSTVCRPGDNLSLTFLCRDEDGLSYEFFLYSWTVDENGHREEYAPSWEYPKLTWSETERRRTCETLP